MDKFEILKLRELPIEGVAERLGLRVRQHRALCPFHDDHSPSLYFNVRKNTFRCFSCGAYGGVIDLALKLLPSGRSGGVPFIDACQWLANENNIILTEYKPKLSLSSSFSSPKVDLVHLSRLIYPPYLNKEARHFLFNERHIHPAVVKWLGLSSISAPSPMTSSRHCPWFNAPSLLIPYKDIDGNLLTVQARYLRPSQLNSLYTPFGSPVIGGRKPLKGGENKSPFLAPRCYASEQVRAKGDLEGPPRFQFPRGSKCHIFNLPVLKMLKEGEDLWLAEGSSDCMALLSSGKKAIAIPSATLLNHEDMRLLSSSLPPSSKLHIYPDQDQAGEKLYTNLLQVATDIRRCLVRHNLPPDCKDFGDYWKRVCESTSQQVNELSPSAPV